MNINHKPPVSETNHLCSSRYLVLKSHCVFLPSALWVLRLSSKLVTVWQCCWWGSIKIQMSWQEASERRYPGDRAQIETSMLKVLYWSRNVFCAKTQLSLGEEGARPYLEISRRDRRQTAFTESCFVVIRRTRGLRVFEWQTWWLHFTNRHPAPRRLRVCLQATAYQKTRRRHPWERRRLSPAWYSAEWAARKWSQTSKLASDCFYEHLRGEIIWSRKAKRFITFPPHFAKQTDGGDNANRW